MRSIAMLMLLYGAVLAAIQHSVSNEDPLAPLSDQTPERKGSIYDLHAMLQGFVICQTSVASPEADEAIIAIQALRARLYTPARQIKTDPPLCTDLTRNGHSVTAICGPEGTSMRSMDAGKMVNQIYRFCRAEIEGKWRLGGLYIFDRETVPVGLVLVYDVRDTEIYAGLGY